MTIKISICVTLMNSKKMAEDTKIVNLRTGKHPAET